MNKRILLADDDESVRKMVARVLNVAGFLAVQAASWSELQSQLEIAEPFLLLLDLDMIEGESELVRAQAERLFGKVPMIGMTALPHQQQTARRWRADFLMEKPLDLALLLFRVEELLAKAGKTGSRPGSKHRSPRSAAR